MQSMRSGACLAPLAPAPSVGEPKGISVRWEEDGAFWFVLEQLYQAAKEQELIGREKILAHARSAGLPVSQKEVRDILADMAERGLVRVGRGRGGSRLMPEGRRLWEERAAYSGMGSR